MGKNRFALRARAVLDIQCTDSLVREDQPAQSEPSQANPNWSIDPRRDAIGLLKKAIKSLEDEFPAEDRLRFAYEKLAEAFRQRKEMDDARASAQGIRSGKQLL